MNKVAIRQTAITPREDLVKRGLQYAAKSKAENTLRAYRTDWNDFAGWCAGQGLDALPAEPGTVALFLVDRAETLKIATLERRLAAIAFSHRENGHAFDMKHPSLARVWQGIRRERGTKRHGKAAVMTEEIIRMVENLPDNLLGIRDRAMLLVGFAGAFRRSELVGLETSDFQFTQDGVVVAVRKSKTDQEGQGSVRGIPYGSRPETCPVRSLKKWLGEAGIDDGPVFRSVNRHGQVRSSRLTTKSVAIVVKRAAERAGLDPENYAGHSLRAGHVTSAAANGVEERVIMNQTGHKRVETLRGYIRMGSLFRENSASRLGL